MKRLVLAVTLAIFGGLLSWVVNAQPNAPVQSFRLDYFPSLPTAIDGCSGTYVYGSILLKKQQYIFVNDFDSKGSQDRR